MLSSPNQLPTPPMTHASPPSPFKLRLRSHKPTDGEDDVTAPSIARRKITKHNNATSRGINKRRRAIDDNATRDSTESDDEINPPDQTAGPSTPKRIRLAPEVLPMGLKPSDFRKLQIEFPDAEDNVEVQDSSREFPDAEDNVEVQDSSREFPDAEDNVEVQDSSREGEDDNEQWLSAEDTLLVELVLEKLKLSKSDWQDCARSLGKDRGSVRRWWKSHMGGGEIGLKSRPRRGNGTVLKRGFVIIY